MPQEVAVGRWYPPSVRTAKRLLAVTVALVVLGCSPVCRLEVRFKLPKSAGAIDYAKLHVRGRVSCDSFDLSAPKPNDPMPPPIGLEENEPDDVAPSLDAGDASVAAADAGDAGAPSFRHSGREVVRPASLRREGDAFQLWERASSCKAAATAWYDTNGNGAPDVGDFVARMPTTDFYDRGLCAGNLTKVGPLDLEPWRP